MPTGPTHIEPALGKLIRQQTTPNHRIGFFTELVDLESVRYQELAPVPRGTLYAATVGADQRVIDTFGALYFTREFAPYGSNTVNTMPSGRFVIWSWSTEQFAEASFNAEVAYLAEHVDYPAYTRVFNVRREVYEATPTLANGTPYTGIVAVKVTSPGTGYTTATVTPASGSATFEAVIDEDGHISAIIVTNDGSGYDSDAPPAITITGDGSGAVAVAVIQPKTAVLVSQKKVELPESDPLRVEFVGVIRVYRRITGPILQGQEYDERFDVVIPYTEQEVPAGTAIGNPRSQVTPINTVIEKVRSADPDALIAALAAYSISAPTIIDIQLPDILESVEVVWETSVGAGSSAETGSTAGAGASYSLSLSIPNSSQGSASVMPEIIPTIRRTDGNDIPAIDYYFFLENPTAASILAKLETVAGGPVSNWPRFRAVSHTFVLRGQKIAVRAEANARVSIHSSNSGVSSAASDGGGTSKDIGSSVRAVALPPTIHGAISLADTTNSELAAAGASANLGSWASFSAVAGGTALGSVEPTSLSPTSPATIPTTGLYLKRLNVDPYKYGWHMVRATVFDAADI